MVSESTAGERRSFGKEFAVVLVVLTAILAFIFRKGFEENQVLFANDSPIGVLISQADTAWQAFTGYWTPNNWLGNEQPSALPTFTSTLFGLMGNPFAFAKLYAPLSLLFAGLCAWYCFRKLGFHSAVCVLGGIAATLNMNSFSNAAWGLPVRAITLGVSFLAVAALHGTLRGWWPLKSMLAGTCIAMGIMEGFDVGALFSLWLGSFAFFVAFLKQGTIGQRLLRGAAQLAVTALFALLVAAAALQTLIGTQIVGVADRQEDPAHKTAQWRFATQWSLPKIESLRVIVPGLFGYRMDTPNGGNYWGAVGRPEGAATGQHSGSGEYAGVLVVVSAIWALAQARRRKDSGYDELQRRYIFFWGIMALLALLFSWGYHAPFYKIIYSLPFLHTIRNPIKFMHMFHFCVLLLFGFGLDHLIRRYCAPVTAKASGLSEQFSQWWKKLSGFEKKWAYGSILAVGLSFLGVMAFSSSRPSLLRYLRSTGFAEPNAEQIIKFAQHELLLFAMFLAVTLVLIAAILSRGFAASRAKFVFVLLGVLLFADLARANRPWIVFYDQTYKYETNPLIDMLKERPFERRVAARFIPTGGPIATDNPNFFYIYFEWLQNQFQALNIQSLDIIQMPRMPAMDENFIRAFSPTQNSPDEYWRMGRLWQLCNTRILLGQRAAEVILKNYVVTNGSLVRARDFEVVRKPTVDPDHRIEVDNFTIQWVTNGTFSVFEYREALPRATLCSFWESSSEDEGALNILRMREFDPTKSMVVVGSAPTPSAPSPTEHKESRITSYAPRKVVIEAEPTQPSILMLNDRYSPHWKAYVDGKEEPLLRCNYIMRGVHIPAGKHTVTFEFKPPTTALYISLASLAVALGICMFLLVQSRRGPAPA